jgi:hypothetical protein
MTLTLITVVTLSIFIAPNPATSILVLLFNHSLHAGYVYLTIVTVMIGLGINNLLTFTKP